MSSYLLTVRDFEVLDDGVRLVPGVPQSHLAEMPEVSRNLMQGSELELRFPDGTTVVTSLVTFGVTVCRDENGEYYFPDHPSRLDLNLTVALPEGVDAIPAGTEVWFVLPE
jgi:hypothetical protein